MKGPLKIARPSVEKLGVYVLPGAADDPRAALAQAQEAERLGLGSLWLSELQGPNKDAGAVCGYLAHATSRIRIGTATTHIGTRHPMAQASWGVTMQGLSQGRFMLGYGRSVAQRWQSWGIEPPSIAAMADHANILRALFRGERVSYDGPAGRFPDLAFEVAPTTPPPPLLLAAIGPKMLAVGGAYYDGVLLHPFLTTDAVRRSIAIARKAAEQAGRDPSAIEIHHLVVTLPDPSDAMMAAVIHGRLGGYLMGGGLGDAMAIANDWDPALLKGFRAHVKTLLAAQPDATTKRSTRELLAEACKALPAAWWEDGIATGSPEKCAERLDDFFACGADRIVLHGIGADKLGGVVGAYRRRHGLE